MLQPIYVTCPRGHLHKAGRASPGLVVRVRGYCPRCRDAHVVVGVVTPFASELADVHRAELPTSISKALVMRGLQAMGNRPGVADQLRKLNGRNGSMTGYDVLEATEVWVRHFGRKGAAIPERDQRIEVVNGTESPQASQTFLKKLVCV